MLEVDVSKVCTPATHVAVPNSAGLGVRKARIQTTRSCISHTKTAVYFAHTGSLFRFVVGHGILCGVMSDLS